MVWLETTLGLSAGTVTKLLITLAIVLVLWFVRWGIVRFLNHRTDRPELRYRWRKVTTYSVMILGLLLVGRVWLEGIQSLVTYFGLLSAGIAIALRDPIVNWFGWIFIGWRRPFLVGDRIQVGPISGDVIDIGVSTFSLLEVADPHDGEQATGRIVHMPNGKVFTEPLINLTQGFKYVWNEIPITVTFESDWETAKEILTRVVHGKVEVGSEEAQQWIRDATRQFLIRTPDVAPAVFTPNRPGRRGVDGSLHVPRSDAALERAGDQRGGTDGIPRRADDRLRLPHEPARPSDRGRKARPAPTSAWGRWNVGAGSQFPVGGS